MSPPDAEPAKSTSPTSPWLDVLNTTAGRFSAAVGALSSVATTVLTLKQMMKPEAAASSGGGIPGWATATALAILLGSLGFYYRQVRKRQKWALPLHTDVFVGARALRDEDTARTGFFGRDADIAELLEKLRDDQMRYLLLFGETGCGKSSLIRAGLIPALNKTGPYHCEYLRFFDRPLEELRQVLRSRVAVSNSNSASASTPGTAPGGDAGQPVSLVEELRQARERVGKTLVLFIDQFEEIHVNPIGSEEIRAIKEMVWSVAGKQASIDAKIVFSLRYDFLHLMDMFEDAEHLDNIFARRSARYHLEHFSEQTARNVMLSMLRGPSGLLWPSELIERILGDLKIERLVHGELRNVVLPTEMQIVCQMVQAQGIRRASEYRGKRQIIRDYVDKAIKTAPSGEDLARNVLLALIDDNRLTKAKPQSLAQIAARTQAGNTGRVQHLLDWLDEERHLIQTKPAHKGHNEALYELGHDHLVRIICDVAGATLSGASLSRSILSASRLQRELNPRYRLSISDCVRLYRYPPDEMKPEDRDFLRRSVRGFVVRFCLPAVALLSLILVVRSTASHLDFDEQDRDALVIRKGLPYLQPLLGSQQVRVQTGMKKYRLPGHKRGVQPLLTDVGRKRWHLDLLRFVHPGLSAEETLRTDLVKIASEYFRSTEDDLAQDEYDYSAATDLLAALGSEQDKADAARTAHNRMLGALGRLASSCTSDSCSPECESGKSVVVHSAEALRRLDPRLNTPALVAKISKEFDAAAPGGWTADACVSALIELRKLDPSIVSRLTSRLRTGIAQHAASTTGEGAPSMTLIVSQFDLLRRALRGPGAVKKIDPELRGQLAALLWKRLEVPGASEQNVLDAVRILALLDYKEEPFVGWLRREKGATAASPLRLRAVWDALWTLKIPLGPADYQVFARILAAGLDNLRSLPNYEPAVVTREAAQRVEDTHDVQRALSLVGLLSDSSYLPPAVWHGLAAAGIDRSLKPMLAEVLRRSRYLGGTPDSLVEAARHVGVSGQDLLKAIPGKLREDTASAALCSVLTDGYCSTAWPPVLPSNPYETDGTRTKEAILLAAIKERIQTANRTPDDVCRWTRIALLHGVQDDEIMRHREESSCGGTVDGMRIWLKGRDGQTLGQKVDLLLEKLDAPGIDARSGDREAVTETIDYLVRDHLWDDEGVDLTHVRDVQAILAKLQERFDRTRSLAVRISLSSLIDWTEMGLSRVDPGRP